MNFLAKIKFLWKRPKVIVVTGNGRALAAEAIFQVLKQNFKVRKISDGRLPQDLRKNEILIFESEDKEIRKFDLFLRESHLSVLAITNIGDIPSYVDFFAGEKEKIKETFDLAKNLPAQNYLILNYDDETVREIDDWTRLQTFTFGLDKNSDFSASDIKLNFGTNFKVNYKGNVVPFWLEKLFGKEQIYAALSAAAVGTIFNLNLVEISQALKNYYSLPGKMRLSEGIKNSWVLDDSQGTTIFSMSEAIEIFGSLQGFKKKIAVLGDVIGIEKYTIEAHETIGERVAKNADLLFTFGLRARFIAQGAAQKGMAIEKIFQFANIDEGKLKLQEEIREGDLILVDGSKEMEMAEIVKEICITTGPIV